MSLRESLRHALLRGSVVALYLHTGKPATVVPAGCDTLCLSMSKSAYNIRLSRLAIHFTTSFDLKPFRVHVPFYAIKAWRELPSDYVWQTLKA